MIFQWREEWMNSLYEGIMDDWKSFYHKRKLLLLSRLEHKRDFLIDIYLIPFTYPIIVINIWLIISTHPKPCH